MSEQKFIETRPGEYMRAVNEEEVIDHCKTCSKKETACISFFAHEDAMMHKDLDNERAHRSTMFVCMFALLFALTFVVAYTIRMNTFVNLIREMNAAIVQLASAKGIAPP